MAWGAPFDDAQLPHGFHGLVAGEGGRVGKHRVQPFERRVAGDAEPLRQPAGERVGCLDGDLLTDDRAHRHLESPEAAGKADSLDPVPFPRLPVEAGKRVRHLAGKAVGVEEPPGLGRKLRDVRREGFRHAEQKAAFAGRLRRLSSPCRPRWRRCGVAAPVHRLHAPDGAEREEIH